MCIRAKEMAQLLKDRLKTKKKKEKNVYESQI